MGSGSLLTGGAALLPGCLFGLWCPSPGACSLLSEARSWCCNGCLPESSRQMNVPQYLRHQCPRLRSRPESTPTSLGDLPKPAGRSGQSSCRVTALPQVPGHMRPCVSSRSGVCAPPVLSSLYTQALLTFKARCSGGFSFQGQTPRLRSMTWGSGLSFLWGNLCNIFQFVGAPHPGK